MINIAKSGQYFSHIKARHSPPVSFVVCPLCTRFYIILTNNVCMMPAIRMLLLVMFLPMLE
jgi:hypothetical protein